MTSDRRDVFIVGCARSGTTWVRSILVAHPDVVSGPESHVFPVLYPRLRSEVSATRWRKQVLAAFDERVGGPPGGPHRWVDRPTLERLLAAAEASGLVGDAAARYVIDGILDDRFLHSRGTTTRVLVEKTPRHLMYADRILAWWPSARIVEVVRDGRDVCVSLAHKSKVVSWAPADRRTQIEQWAEAVRQGMSLRSTPAARGRWHVVRYEDLRENTEEEIRRLYRFVGLWADHEFVSQVGEQTGFANAKRASTVGHHVRKGEVGAWRNEFTESDTREFERLAGDLLTALGYGR
jgi:hypothetical protein